MPFPVEEKYVSLAEQELKVVFPESYRSKMMTENGGEVEFNGIIWELHPVFDKSDKKRISRTCNHIVLETENMKKWNNFPKNAISIAADGTGNALVFLPKLLSKKKLDSKVYEWNHETGKTQMVSKTFSK